MSKNIVTATLAAMACAAVVSAQAPQTPQTPAPPSQPPAPTERAPAAKPASADNLTITGCVERRADASSATPGSVGTSGGSGFILTKVAKPTGTSGSSSAAAAAPAATYRLDADASKLSGHVGHKVEIMGTASKVGSGETPELKVDTVKMIAPTCAE